MLALDPWREMAGPFMLLKLIFLHHKLNVRINVEHSVCHHSCFSSSYHLAKCVTEKKNLLLGLVVYVLQD